MSRFLTDAITPGAVAGVDTIANNLIKAMEERGRNERHQKELKQRESDLSKQLEEAAKAREFQGQQSEMDRMSRSQDFAALNESRERIAANEQEARAAQMEQQQAFQAEQADLNRQWQERLTLEKQTREDAQHQEHLEILRAGLKDEKASRSAQNEKELEIARIDAMISLSKEELMDSSEEGQKSRLRMMQDVRQIADEAEVLSARVEEGVTDGFNELAVALNKGADRDDFFARPHTGEKTTTFGRAGEQITSSVTRDVSSTDIANRIIDSVAEGASHMLSKNGQPVSGTTRDRLSSFMKTLMGVQGKIKANPEAGISDADRQAIMEHAEQLYEVMDETNVRLAIRQISRQAELQRKATKTSDLVIEGRDGKTRFTGKQAELVGEGMELVGSLDDVLIAATGSAAFMTPEYLRTFESVAEQLFAEDLKDRESAEAFFEDSDTLPPAQEAKLIEALEQSGAFDASTSRQTAKDELRKLQQQRVESFATADEPLQDTETEKLLDKLLQQ